jgi:hypothetical protein
MNEDSYVIKISGKAQLPYAIKAGHNWRVSSEGSVVSETISDNEDGSFTHTYTYKPVRVEVMTPLGETLKLADTRSDSQLFRAMMFKIWKAQNDLRNFDQVYHDGMRQMIDAGADIYGMYFS